MSEERKQQLDHIAPDYIDKKYREEPASVLYLENGLFIATKTLVGFGVSPEDAVRNLEDGLAWRDVRTTRPSQ